MNEVNITTTILLSAIVPALGTSSDTAYLWDLIEPVQRFLLLNQTSISTTLSWNVTQQFLQNKSSINWLSIPSNVQLFLGEELILNQLLNLTFFSWGWTDSNSTFASSTLFSLLNLQGQENLPIIQSITTKLTFSTILNTTILKESDRRKTPSYQVRKLFEEFKEALSFEPFQQLANNHHFNQPIVNTPFNIIESALQRAFFTVQAYAISTGNYLSHYKYCYLLILFLFL